MPIKTIHKKLLHFVTVIGLLCLLILAGCAPIDPQEMPTTRDIDLADIRSRIEKTPRSSILLEQDEDDVHKQRQAPESDTIIQGDGRNQQLLRILEHTTSPRPQAEPLDPDAPTITLNFDNADIYEVIHVIGDLLGLNYIIDPGVTGVVNIRSSKPVPLAELREVFLKILHINGLDLRDEGINSYIFTSSKPYSGKLSTGEDIGNLKPSSRIMLQVVPLLHLQAEDSVKLVEQYLSANGSIQPLAAHNWLLIHDYESNIIDILTILSQLDVSPLESLNIRLVRIHNAPIQEIKDEVDEIFKALKVNKGKQDGLTIVPLGQVNSLLLVSPSEYLVENGARWIKELDITVGSDRDNIYIYNAKNTVATELASLVNRLITDPDAVGTKSKSATKGVIGKGQKTASKSKDNPKTLSSLRFAGTPMLIADDNRNIVLIRALPPDYSRIVKLLERLDNLPRQVLVEVIVAEVYLKDELSMGVEWAIDNNFLGSNNGTDYTMDVASTVFNAENAITNGLSMIINSGDDVAALLHALAGRTNLSILSSPQVLVLNNETATVNVGEEVPIVTSVTENNATADKVDKTIQYKDTGVILEVTPQINYDGIILLDIKQTISKAMEIPENGVQSAPIRKRELKTKLAVKDGQSILIGGLIGTDRVVSDSGIPFLKDIPLLGYLFKYETQKVEKTELLIMLTLYVIESEQVLDQYINEFKTTMDGFRNELHSNNNPEK